MAENTRARRGFSFPREVLLVEVERRCAGPACGAATRLALTKDEARAYTGFQCERCGRRHEDVLSERDVPDWWEELAVTGLAGVRADDRRPGPDAGPGEVVERLSQGWRRVREEGGAVAGAGEEEGERG